LDYSTSLLTLIAWKILPDELRYVTLTIRGCCDRPRVRIRVHMSCGEMLFHHIYINYFQYVYNKAIIVLTSHPCFIENLTIFFL